MDPFIQGLYQSAASKKKNIILPEASDPRVLEAAEILLSQGLCKVSLIGEPDDCRKSGLKLKDAKFFVPGDTALTKEFTGIYYGLRKEKGLSWTEAKRSVKNPLTLAALLLKTGRVDGMVAGSMASTSDVLRSGLQIIGTAPGSRTVSSFFIMIVPDAQLGEGGLLFFADCGVIPSPTPIQLADIVMDTAMNFRRLVSKEPRVAMLSFSTKGSASHPDVDRVTEAYKNVCNRSSLDFSVDGELQVDAALVPAVFSKKAPDSSIKGQANILVFPDLSSGNIAYKLVQRFAGAQAYGPIIQGLASPINDLSRGCSVQDIVNVSVITAVQAT